MLTGDTSIWEPDGLGPPGPDALRLDGRVALVTGAAQGIGEAIALAMARCGADVALCDRNQDKLEATAAGIEALGRAAPTAVLDVRDDDAVADWIGEVGERFGAVDIVVNNAGGGFVAPFLDISTKGEAALVAENFTSVASVIRHSSPWLPGGDRRVGPTDRSTTVERGDGAVAESGSIVNVTSIEAHRAGPGFSIYTAMKAAVASLTQTLSMELAHRRIRVNCIACDVTPTEGDAELMAASGASATDQWASQTWPEKGSVHDSAAAALFLASDLSRFVTGSSIHVDGGNWAAGGWKVKLDDGAFVL